MSTPQLNCKFADVSLSSSLSLSLISLSLSFSSLSFSLSSLSLSHLSLFLSLSSLFLQLSLFLHLSLSGMQRLLRELEEVKERLAPERSDSNNEEEEKEEDDDDPDYEKIDDLHFLKKEGKMAPESQEKNDNPKNVSLCVCAFCSS